MAAPMSTASQRLSIEFVVKPTEDLFLEGSLRRIPRVAKGMHMQKTFDSKFLEIGFDVKQLL